MFGHRFLALVLQLYTIAGKKMLLSTVTATFFIQMWLVRSM